MWNVAPIKYFYEMIYVIRNSHEYGPYDESVVAGNHRLVVGAILV